MRSTPFLDAIRAGAAAVADTATLVHIDHDALDRLAATIDPVPPEPFAEEQWSGPIEDRVMGIVAWNTVNFGSGWFPTVTKLPGKSGARTLATHWQTWCSAHGVPDAAWLASVTTRRAAEVLAQPDDPDDDVHGLLVAFRDAWQEMGNHLIDHYGGSALALVEDACGSADRLAAGLAVLPAWDDRHRLGPIEVPLYKRAQIVVSHLAGALDGHPLGRFDDVDHLTAFADNLVPHVLRHLGVLTVDAELAGRIDREEPLRSGEAGEIELRAVAVHAVELLRNQIDTFGRGTPTAATLDHRLWQMGQDPTIKARARHRCRNTYY